MYNVSGGNLAIGISLLLRDGFSGPAATASASMTRLQRQQQSMMRQNMTMARNANLLGAAVGIGVISKMSGWIKQGSEYGYTMQYVSSLTKATDKDFASLDRTAKHLGQTTMFSSKSIASGMRYMAMAGQDAKQIKANIAAATDLSIAGMIDLGGKGGGADIMTNVMSGFQIGSQHSRRVADIITTAATGANTSVMDLGEALKYSAATAMDLNVTLEETAVMAMMAGNAGIQGSMAGTAIENMLRYITMATSGERKKATAGLAALGLAPEDLKTAKGDMKSIGSIMETISKKGQQAMLGNADMQNIYIRLFGVRGKRQASLMLRKMGEYKTFMDELNNKSHGNSAMIAGTQMETLSGRMKQWSDTMENLKIAYAEAVEPVLKPFIRLLSMIAKGLNAIMGTKFGGFLAILASGWVIAKTASLAYRAIMLTITLITTRVGAATVATTNSTAMGWNAATAAVLRYRAASGMSGAAGVGGMWGSDTSRTARGGYRDNRTGRFIAAPGGRSRGRFGRMRGKMGFGAGMVGTIGLGLASNAVGTESTGGKVLSTLADAANYGMIGATIGSIIPGIGTAIGGAAGAIGGALWSIYNQINEVDAEVKNVVENDKPKFNSENWRRRAELYMSMKDGEVRTAGLDPSHPSQGKSYKELIDVIQNENVTYEIVVNLDGTEYLRKTEIGDKGSKAEFNLGID